ncbi:molybdopterin-guanine dinucleotide biosynthesis protein B, partial [mine drainage metagenome]
APLPAGADAVCMVERAELDGDEIALAVPVAAGENVRYPGEDIAKGSVVFEPFTELTPAHIGVLASLGERAVAVYPSLCVGVLSTGDELMAGAGPLERGQIHDSNRHLLLALARSVGCEPVDLGVVGDDEAAITQAIESAVGACDAILTSGGVSVGVADHMKKV